MCKYLIAPLVLLAVGWGSNSTAMAFGYSDDGSGDKGSYTVRGDEKYSDTGIGTDTGQADPAQGEEASTGLPMGIKLYPGAEIQTGTPGKDEGKSGIRTIFKTADSAEAVIKFYRNELESNGVMFKTEILSGDNRIIGGERSDGEGVYISVTKSPDGGVTGTITASVDR